MPTLVNGVTINHQVQTKSTVAKENAKRVVDFFSYYLKDIEAFYDLWVADEPKIFIPFDSSDIDVGSVNVRTGWDAIRGFYDPIFNDMKGTFTWTIDQFIVGEDPNIIITKSFSNIDVTVSGVWGPERQVAYKGVYLQIFTFENLKIKSFEEYVDTNLINSKYAI